VLTPYVIETGIPLPPPMRAGGGNNVGPKTEWTMVLARLEPGQSVLTADHGEFKTADAFVSRQRPKRFAIRKINGQGWRVWRLE
jgi:hypothetical protein